MVKSTKKKVTKSSNVSAGGFAKTAVGIGSALLSRSNKKTSGHRRSHGVQWYANAVLKAKLKKKLMRIKYGSV